MGRSLLGATGSDPGRMALRFQSGQMDLPTDEERSPSCQQHLTDIHGEVVAAMLG